MRMTEIIAKKRDGGSLSPEEIRFFVNTYTHGETPDYQASALLMAICLRGMDAGETGALTAAMAESGQQIDLSELRGQGSGVGGRGRVSGNEHHATGKVTSPTPDPRPLTPPTLDKHSTGGVGDKTSLVVVPMLAAAGAYLCKMSGRGLGHTGGTLDKLEAIPGFRVGLTPSEMLAQVRRVGACLAGQTADLAPADKKIYALRDATATVGSLPLIASSILSKKLAGGAEAFLFDVKIGNGALMPEEDRMRALAQALVDGAKANGRRAVAVLSDMSQPLGRTVGNALEVAEAIQTLTPGSTGVDARFRELCIGLTAAGLRLTGLAEGDRAQERAAELLDSGAALSLFRQIVAAQGGDVSFVDNPEKLPTAPIIKPITSETDGWIAAVETNTLGHIGVSLGGGRAKKEDTIDPAVGLVIHAPIGKQVRVGETLVEVHARTLEDFERVAGQIRAAYRLSSEKVFAPPLFVGSCSTETR